MYRYTCSEQSADAATVACGVEIVASLIRAGGTGEGDLPTVARALVARMAEKRRAMEGAADFIAAPSFRGHKEGFVFMTASEGLGYYRDVGSTIAAPKEASSEDLEACNAARERGNAFYKAKDHAGALEVRVICFVCARFISLILCCDLSSFFRSLHYNRRTTRRLPRCHRTKRRCQTDRCCACRQATSTERWRMR